MPIPLGAFDDPDMLVTLLRQRQRALELSNQALEGLCGWSDGMTDKYLGPSRSKVLTAPQLAVLMEALGLSAVLVIDEAKVARMARRYAAAGRRHEPSVRDKHRVGREALKRARPVVLAELAKKGGTARWKGATDEQRLVAGRQLAEARQRKAMSRHMSESTPSA